MKKINFKDILSTDLADLDGEIWKEIPGYCGKYLISQYSRVKSVIKKDPLILRKSISSGKYKVTLIGKYGRLISEDVGRLCAKVHIRPAAENEVIEYLDGNKLNDQAGNLKWITWQESRKKTISRYRASNKKINAGCNNGRAVIDEAKARDIRSLRNQGKKYSEIASIHQISEGIVQRVVQGRTWKSA
ncbi:NUMOD4 domain-containing protein [Chryseobacterium cucumeris]|uniref:NUMOD4 domain-containing protein n=1 Tax=Chryseobacterium cucumeris TaxID=1813611 RepID=UPI00320B63C2